MVFDPDNKCIVSQRLAQDGRPADPEDNDWYYILVEDGLLELEERYRVENPTAGIDDQWPATECEMAECQGRDDDLQKLIDQAEQMPIDERATAQWMLKVNDEDHRLLLHHVKLHQKIKSSDEFEEMVEIIRGRKQIVVPTGLRKKAMMLFHDLNGHPGARRTRHTLRYYYLGIVRT